MKKYLIPLLTLFILFGCGKKENPLTPNYGNKASASNLPTISQITPSNYGEIQDENGNVTGIQSEIVVTFSDYMDASTINTTNITLYNIGNGSSVDLTIDYDAERKTAYITPSSGKFPDNAGFLLTIGNGVHNLAGLPLDGNGNGKQDGAPYDNALYAFYTGTGNNISSNVRTSPPTIASVSPTEGGGVSVDVPIIIRFSNGPIDTTCFTTQNFHLKDETGTPVSDSIESYGSDSVKIVLSGGDTLDRGTMYTFTIDAYKIFAEKDTGSESGNSATEHLMRLDANGDGVISADEDSFYTWKFITQDFPGTDSATPPHVNTGATGDNGTYYQFTFDKPMDASTFTKENIKVFDNNGYVPGTFRVEMDSTGLKYYYDREITGTARGWVSMEVKDKYGNKLDGNGNGIGGEAGKDDWPSTGGGATIFSDDFESPGGGWTTGGALNEWQRGIPTGTGPSSAYSGQYCYGTVINGAYSSNSDGYLASRAITLPNSGNPHLYFWHWFDIYGDNPGYSLDSGGWVEISTDGGVSWNPISPDSGQYYNEFLDSNAPNPNGSCFGQSSGGWVCSRFDLSGYTGSTIKIRFYFWADPSVDPGTYAGWYIDDVYITR